MELARRALLLTPGLRTVTVRVLLVVAWTTAAYIYLMADPAPRAGYRAVALFDAGVAGLVVTTWLAVLLYDLPLHPLGEWMLGGLAVYLIIQAVALASVEWSSDFARWAFRAASGAYTVMMLAIARAAFRHADWSPFRSPERAGGHA